MRFLAGARNDSEEGTSEIQRLVIARAISGVQLR